ncbi:hypothetical protein RhiirA4_497694 [Rhizophagus irregularis]|uniref:Uncharacterized protein n=1 Tax=Rhizophagus irregularis TaxID=588596 RepID=A0A2I1H1Z9_9GLOM|nr:hypothetical protein RhiirA4_497694 [Rhizophagus irregularis]
MEQSHKSDRSGRSHTRSHTKSRRTSRSRTKSHHRTGRSRTRSHTKSRRTSRSRTRSHHRTGRSRTRSNTKSRTQSHTNERENGPFHLVLPPELEHAYEIDFRNKPTGFVSSDDESGKKDHQPSKKKSKMPEKSKKSSSIKASNKSTEVVSSDDESHQPKKNSKNSKKKSKSKKSKKQRKRKQSTSRSDSRSNSSSERTSGLETDSSPAAPRKVTYHSLTELPKDTKDNLRREVKWNIKRMPTGSQLDINKTFESQKDLVTKIIIPALFKVLDTNAYPVSEGVLYEMIHQRHRHQREDLLKKEKSESERTEETKRKHGNSRRSELRMFLRDYLDVLFYQQTVDKRRRKRVFDNSQYAPGEETAPLNAPRWTRSGYKGSMLSIITGELKKYRENDDDDDIGHHSRKKPKSVEGIHNVK